MRVLAALSVLIILGAAGLVRGQTPDAAAISVHPTLELQAKYYGDAFVQRDFAQLVDLTYAGYTGGQAGRQALIRIAGQTRKQFETNGMEVVSWAPGKPTQVISESGSLYAVVPMVMRLKREQKVFEFHQCLIAISSDYGQHWTFISPSCVKVEEMFPEVADKLILCPSDPVQPSM